MTKADVLAAIKGTQFEKDLEAPLLLNGTPITKGMYNLVVCIKDAKLMAVGLKCRGLNITMIKKYFGVKGTTKEIAPKLEAYKVALMAA